MTPRTLRAFFWILLIAGLAALGALPSGAAPARAAEGPALEYVDLSVGGVRIRVKAGGVLALHPDAPFVVLAARVDAWLVGRLTYQLPDAPGQDLTQYKSLAEIFGPKIWDLKDTPLVVAKADKPLGRITLIPRWLPIDYLRKAEASAKPADKIKYTELALELSPGDRLLVLRLVELLSEAKRFKEAAALLEDAVKAGDDPEALLRLADLYQTMGEKQRSAALLSQLLADGKGDPRLVERLARLNRDLKRWKEAAGLWQRLAASRPAEERSQLLLKASQDLQKAGLKREARQVLEKAVAGRSWDAGLWKGLAALRAEDGDPAGAVQALEKAADLSPTDRGLLLELAQAHQAAGDLAKAAARLEAALALTPGDKKLTAGLVKLYEQMGDSKGLVKAYRRLADGSPDDPEAQMALGKLLIDQNQPAEAVAPLKRAARLKPEDSRAGLLLYATLAGLGRWPEAVAQAASLQKKHPGDLSIIDKVYPALSEHRPEDMAKLLDAAIKASPDKAKLYMLRAALALGADQPAKAAEVLEAGVKAAPGDLEMLRSLARVYESNGRVKQALETWSRVLDQAPEDEDARENYLRLKTASLGSGRTTPEPLPEADKPADPKEPAPEKAN